MLIDWFTVGAQVLNFLVLVFLLRHFLYRPILNAIDAREKGITAKLADAEQKAKDAQNQRDDLAGKNKAFDSERAALMTKATDDAKTEHDRLIGEAHHEANGLRAAQAAALKDDEVRLAKEMSSTVSVGVIAIARKALSDLAAASLEERVGAVFTRRLGEMNGEAKRTLGDALKSSGDPAVVRSAFEMPAVQRGFIQNAVNVVFSADIPLRYETAPDQICGIELTAGGQRIAWSIAEYLTSLQLKAAALLGPE